MPFGKFFRLQFVKKGDRKIPVQAQREELLDTCSELHLDLPTSRILSLCRTCATANHLQSYFQAQH